MSATLELSDGQRVLDLVSSTPGTGIMLQEFKPPLVAHDNTFAESADSVGRLRVRSRPQNAEGEGKVLIAHNVQATFLDYVDNFAEIIQAVHDRRGTLRYVPLAGATAVTYDVESCEITEAPQDWMHRRVCEIGFKFECLPFGRLDPVTVFSGQSVGGPIAGVEAVTVPGQVDALGTLTLTDTASQARGHVEVGVQVDYNPASPEPLSLSLASGLTTAGFAGSITSRAGSIASNIARATLATAPTTVCGTTAQPHKGTWKVRARVYPTSGAVRVRLAWKVGDGPVTYERWVNCNSSDYFDLDLETIRIEQLETGHSWTGYIEAYATTGNPTVDVDTLFLVPA